MKGFLVRAEDTFVCKTCEREVDEEDRNVESFDLGNGVHLENVGKFYYLGDMLNGDGVNSASMAFLVFEQVIGTTLVLQLCSCDCSKIVS